MDTKQHVSITQQSTGKENNGQEVKRDWKSTNNVDHKSKSSIDNKKGIDNTVNDVKIDDNNIKDRNVDNTKDKIPMEVDNKVKSNKEDLDNVRDDDNLSNDEDQEEFDEATTEIPTLETYIPKKPTYHVANAIPFAELCKR